MPLLHTSIPNLVQGVSQQPDNLRYPGQCDEQINAWSTVVEGLVKRPNSRFLYDTGLGANIGTDLFSHYVDRDEQNKYLLTYDSTNKLRAFDLTQDNISLATLPITVEDAAASLYLTSATNPVKDLRALTIADSTFLVSKKKTVLKNTTLKSKDLEKEALIFVKLGDYEKTYDVFLDNQLVPFDSGAPNQSNSTPPSGHTYESGSATSGGSQTGEHADTELIAQDLQEQIDAFVGSAGVLSGVSFSIGTGSGFTPSGGNYSRYVSYTYTVNQTIASTGAVSSGAGGEIVFDANGRVSSSTLTHKGTGYDSDISTNPLSLVIKKITKITVNKGIRSISGRYSTTYETEVITGAPYTLPTFTATVSGSTTKFTTERQNSVIKITSDSDFQIKVADGLANQALGVIYKEVDNITDLPKECFNLFRVKIIGDADLDQDDYYVKFKTKDNEDFGEGSWIEDAGWTDEGTDKSESVGIETFFDQETMPVRLVPTPATGKITGFTLKLIDWTPRGAGDDNTNPFPSFTNNKINDIFFFKNRLGVLTDDAVVFSEADEYFNFFRTTTQSLLDSAPIDVGVSHTKISILQHAQAFQEKLMIFSPKTQFVLRGGDLLTPKTVTISPVTEYDVSDSVRPLALSSYIYFNFKRNNFEGVLEYTVDNNTETYRAAEITEQVNKYIPNNIIRMEGSAAENMVVVQSDSDYKKLYLYKYFWQGNEKIQSAWMAFTFEREIRSFYFIEATLYVITSDSSGTYLEKIPMENNLVESDQDYAILLDSRVDGNSFSSEPTNPNPTATTEVGMKVVFLTNTTDFPVNTYGEITAKDTDPFDTGFTFPTTNGTPHYSAPYPQVRVINKWHPFITAGSDYDLVQVQIVGGVLNNMKFGNTSSGSQWVGLGAGRGVDWEVLYDTPVVYHTIRSDETSVSDTFYENVPAESRATRWEAIAGDIFYNTATEETTIFQIPYDTAGIELYTKLGTKKEISIANSSTINVTGVLSSYVSYSGSIYKCIETHTSTDSETPDTSAKWAVSTDLLSASAWSSGKFYNDDTYFFIGKPYTMLYRFSDQALKQPTERGGRSASDYTFQTIRNGSINYADTGHFVVEVTPKYRDTYSYVFNPAVLGADLLLNDFTPQDGYFRFAVQGQPGEVTIEVKSSSALPCKLLAAEFESTMIPRSRRYGS